jgi:hypothetical protein
LKLSECSLRLLNEGPNKVFNPVSISGSISGKRWNLVVCKNCPQDAISMASADPQVLEGPDIQSGASHFGLVSLLGGIAHPLSRRWNLLK